MSHTIDDYEFGRDMSQVTIQKLHILVGLNHSGSKCMRHSMGMTIMTTNACIVEEVMGGWRDGGYISNKLTHCCRTDQHQEWCAVEKGNKRPNNKTLLSKSLFLSFIKMYAECDSTFQTIAVIEGTIERPPFLLILLSLVKRTHSWNEYEMISLI
jgi:hypothetical protein